MNLGFQLIRSHLSVAKDTVYRWSDAKGLPAQRIGHLWKFKLSDVDAWVRTGIATEGDGEGALGKSLR